jgi:hypothetical protein
MTAAENEAAQLTGQELSPLVQKALLIFADAADSIELLTAAMPADVRQAIAWEVEVAVAWKRLREASETPHD